MRLFAAIPVVDPARAALVRLLAACRAAPWPVRWVSNDGLHLTVKFFGKIADERLPGILDAVREAAAGTGPLDLQLAGLGAFPAGARARVLWAGIEGPPALELLQHRLERAADTIGFPPEGRPFRPHVTLGRVLDGERVSVPAFVAATPLESVAFVADRVVVYESQLGAGPRGGARHAPRLVVPLA